MEANLRKEILESALIKSFVDDYKEYNNTVIFINKDFLNSNIDFQYTYDQFCVEFLNVTLKNLEENNIFEASEFGEFYSNFWEFNLYNLQSMLNDKLENLGYEYEDFYNGSNIRRKINNKFLK